MEKKTLRLFYSKSVEAWSCRRKYKHRNIDWLIPKGKNMNFARGSYVHLVMEKAWEFLLILSKEERKEPRNIDMAFGVALSKTDHIQQEFDIETQELSRAMVHALWPLVQSQNIVEVEEAKQFSFTNDKGIEATWIVKTDSIISEPYGFWQGEYKTTKSYSSTIQNLYHNGIQPWVYLWFLKTFDKTLEPLQGVRLFVATKPLKRAPKGRPMPPGATTEDMPINNTMMEKAKHYINDSVTLIHKLEEDGTYPKNRNECISYYGDCSYMLLCEPGVDENETYRQSVIDQMFHQEDPEAHHAKTEV